MRQTKKFLFLTIALLTMFESTSLHAQDRKTTLFRVGKTSKGRYDVSVEMYNGRFWNSLIPEYKEAFLGGLVEGVLAYYVKSGVATTDKQSDYIHLKDSFFAEGFTPSELANIIDSLYKDSSNVKIPISEVLRVAVRKCKGLSQQELDDLLPSLRKQFLN